MKNQTFDIQFYKRKDGTDMVTLRGTAEDMKAYVADAELKNNFSEVTDMKTWLKQQTVDGQSVDLIVAFLLDWGTKGMVVGPKLITSATGLRRDSAKRLLRLLHDDGWLNENDLLERGAMSRLEKEHAKRSP